MTAPDQLPTTGAASKALAILGGWLIVGGLFGIALGKIMKGAN